MQAEIDILTVRTSAHHGIHADKTDLLVTIKGTSLVTGSATLKEAHKVRQLVAVLAPPTPPKPYTRYCQSLVNGWGTCKPD